MLVGGPLSPGTSASAEAVCVCLFGVLRAISDRSLVTGQTLRGRSRIARWEGRWNGLGQAPLFARCRPCEMATGATWPVVFCAR